MLAEAQRAYTGRMKRPRPLLTAVTAISLLALSGCVLNPTVKETEHDGVLIERKFVEVARQDGGDAGMLVPIARVGIVAVPLFGSGPKVNWYRHSVRLADGRVVAIIAQGEAHEVGSCVRIFERPGGFAQERITYGFNCPAKG